MRIYQDEIAPLSLIYYSLPLFCLFPSSAAVAQVTVNHLVAGSNPASGAI